MKALVQTQSLNKLSQGSLALLFTFGGFFPVCSIILHCLGILPLQQCLLFLVVPVLILFITLGIKFPSIGKTVVMGFVAGIISVFLYDLSRVPYILAGWSDFIPKIGGWVTNTDEKNALLGYTWRYIGNGGGMGIAFFILMTQLNNNKHLILKGLLFGLFIFTGLMLVLFFFEQTQAMMFKITPVSFTGSITGHIIYGLSLGFIAKRTFGK
ncbi:MAG: hypothetical protein KBG47_05650 [Bacteroidia bacterium]|jgi:uncharacterized membrane protein|nr:hypothetical protein [Sphingobacteriaceae bacterium]MBK7311617.1 hypothetical protein [Sphingobacteriaceae bacterium]MBK7819226.1 hypothetical protein [Sphingobacteriaceae bacterium]MBP9068970.1 hypothetical protein [Bacteroidia bacterium]